MRVENVVLDEIDQKTAALTPAEPVLVIWILILDVANECLGSFIPSLEMTPSKAHEVYANLHLSVNNVFFRHIAHAFVLHAGEISS